MYLGIDIGTSGVKAVAIGDDGAVMAQSVATLDVARPHPLWSEQDPEAWWAAVGTAVLGIADPIRQRVRAIGLAGQMHGATLIDGDGRPLRPAILWNDGRSFAECAELEAKEPNTHAITGNLAMPGFTAPKLLWVRTHEPETFDRIACVLLPKDYVRLRMTGDHASDMSDSAGTLWLDVAGRRWSEPMLATTGLSIAQMPTLHEGSDLTGQLRPAVAKAWGMNVVPVAAGGGDNAAGAAGVGVIADGDALLSLGTSGVIFVATDRFRPNPARAVHAFCHCLPDRFHQMAVHLSAASCLDWCARQLGVKGAADVIALAEGVRIGGGPELFLPYLSGERTPHNDPHIRGAFLGLDNDTSPARLAAAVLEGVAFAHADGLAALREAGATVAELTLIGGGARSRHWATIIATALDARLIFIEGGEIGPALGAAKLAQIAVAGADPADICRRPAVVDIVAPDLELADALAEKFTRFRAAYRALRLS